MIDHLRISGLGVIGEATVDLDPGFTVVTGETGAGKTMVVTALGLLLGARADAGAVRRGSSRAVVDAGVRLPEARLVVERMHGRRIERLRLIPDYLASGFGGAS